jgi:hypothetical protein
VEGAEVHFFEVEADADLGEAAGDAGAELLGGLVGEGSDEGGLRSGAFAEEKGDDALDKREGLAGTGAGNDEQGAFGAFDGLLLFGGGFGAESAFGHRRSLAKNKPPRWGVAAGGLPWWDDIVAGAAAGPIMPRAGLEPRGFSLLSRGLYHFLDGSANSKGRAHVLCVGRCGRVYRSPAKMRSVATLAASDGPWLAGYFAVAAYSSVRTFIGNSPGGMSPKDRGNVQAERCRGLGHFDVIGEAGQGVAGVGQVAFETLGGTP